MSESEANNVTQTPEEPTLEQVLAAMGTCEPYTVSDLVDRYDDVSRWTIQRRLDTLVEEGEVCKKKHTENRVSYWIEIGESDD